MKLGSLCEQNENRVAITPSVAKNLIKLGCSIVLEHNYGNHLFDSALFTDVGVEFASKQDVLAAAPAQAASQAVPLNPMVSLLAHALAETSSDRSPSPSESKPITP